MSLTLPAVAEPHHSLPALLERAGQRLLEARSSAEVLEAKRLAEAALHYAKVTKAANETHADCLRIIAHAEMRMADEVDRGQAAGEIARKNQPVSQYVQASDIPTFEELGISRQRVSEWREIRDAGEHVVEQALQSALNEGRAPTKTDIIKRVRGTFGTGEFEWYTPERYIYAAREVMGSFDLDPATHPAAQQTVQAARYYTADDDGLSQQWHGRVWLNPPYAQPLMSRFVGKLVDEFRAARVTQAIMLTHNYTDTAWFHDAQSVASAVCFTRGRIKFIDTTGKECAPVQGQAFFYFGDQMDRFHATFGVFGFVVPRWKGIGT